MMETLVRAWWLINWQMQHSNGFTLIELIMVVIILSITSMVIVPKFVNTQTFYAAAEYDAFVDDLYFAK